MPGSLAPGAPGHLAFAQFLTILTLSVFSMLQQSQSLSFAMILVDSFSFLSPELLFYLTVTEEDFGCDLFF
jgi:hypothetical protein